MQTQRGFADYLQYFAMIRPGIMKLKSGAYMGGYLYRGPDQESESKAKVEALSAQFNNAIKTLDEGWMIHQISVRVPAHEYPEGDFDEITNFLIDLERAHGFVNEGLHFETHHFLFLTFLPPVLLQNKGAKKVTDWLMGTQLERGQDYESRDVKNFEEVLNKFETLFSQEIYYRRLKFNAEEQNDEMVHALNIIMNRQNHRVLLPNLIDIDSFLARDIENGEYLVYDNRLAAVISIDGFPSHSRPGLLSEIEKLPMEMIWSSRFIINDYHASRNKINDLRRKWHQKERSMFSKIMNNGQGPLDQNALAMGRELDSLAAHIESHSVVFGHYTSTIVLFAEDEDMLRRQIREVTRICDQLGFNIRVESRNALEAFIGSFPGHGRENVRKPFLHSLNYADLAPLNADWCGSKHCPCPAPNYSPYSPALLQAASIGTTPFRLNLHVDDVGHTLIVGPTGSGKSTLLALIASQFERYTDSQVFVFDKGFSLYALISACFDAAHYDMGEFNQSALGALCPLAEIDSQEDRGWALEYLLTLLQLQLQDLSDTISAKDKILVQEALTTLAHETNEASQRTITNFIMTVQSDKVKTLLKSYQLGSAGGNFIDGVHDGIRYKSMTCFEMEELMSYGQKVQAPVLLYLFRQIEKRLDGRPTLLIIDEAWAALDIPSFETKIREWLKVLRKKNCAVILATQNVSDIEKSVICDALVESCPTKIYLANPEASNELSKKTYMRVMGLNEIQVDLISSMVRKRHYYIVNSLGRRVFELGLGPIALSFVGAGSKEELKKIRELQNEFQDEWPAEWLKSRGLDTAATAWLNGYKKLVVPQQ